MKTLCNSLNIMWYRLILGLAVVLSLQVLDGLSSAPLLKKIAIVGGGPAGLGLAAGLVAKLPPYWAGEILLLESRESILQAGLGGGVQLSGGCAVLEELGLFSEFKTIAEPLTRVLARNSRLEKLFDLSVRACLDQHATDLIDTDGNPKVYSVMRDSLQGLLARRLAGERRVRVLTGAECAGLSEHGGQATIRLANGSDLSGLDLVFCADGVGSLGPAYVASSRRVWWNPLGTLLESAVRGLNMRYSGVRIVYGVTTEDPSFALRPEPGSRGAFHQFLGDGCYALLASYGCTDGGPRHMVAIVDSDQDEIKLDNYAEDAENVRWQSVDMRAKVAARLQRSGLASVPALSRILAACEDTRFVELRLRDRLLPLAHWGCASGRVILVGDSAHSMPPFLGQGANQALQDALYLAHGVAEIETSGSGVDLSGSLRRLVTEYEDRRRVFTTLLGVKSSALGRIETFGGTVGNPFKEGFFRVMAAIGVVSHSFADAAKPRL